MPSETSNANEQDFESDERIFMDHSSLPAAAYNDIVNDSEISLLDLLVTLADNLKLLILGPLAAGLCALAVGFAWPKTFESVAMLQAEPAIASLITTAAVLDPVAASLGLGRDNTAEEARLKLRERLKSAVGRNDKLLTLTASGATPQQAQDTANAVLAAVYEQSRPKGSVKERLERQLSEAQGRLKNAQKAASNLLLMMEAPSGSGASAGRGELPRGYADLLGAAAAAQRQVSDIEALLEGLTPSQLVQTPTLPEKAASPHKGLLAVGVALGGGFALLLVVFVRNGVKNAAEDPLSAAKLKRIRRALGLRPLPAQTIEPSRLG